MLAKWIVIFSGIGLIILVNWYFLFSRKKSSHADLQEKGIQEIKVIIKGGYSPDVIVVKKGIPVRINFYRDETADCSDTIVFGEFKIRKALPAYKTTPIEFTPNKKGEYEFTCGMGMLRGKLIVMD